MANDGPDLSELTAWVRRVHEVLAASTAEHVGALWGPVRMRHRTTRPDWFGGFDQAWAVPLRAEANVDTAADADSGAAAGGAADAAAAHTQAPTVDLITAAFDDVPPDLPPAPLRRGDLGPRGEVLALADAPLRMVWEEDAGQVLAWDRESGAALLLVSAQPNGYERVSPTRFLVHWATAAAGGMLVHGAVVGRRRQTSEPGPHFSAPPRGLILLGEAGYGKSTSTLACLQRGWVTCGDDAVALFPDDLGWRACAVYAAVKTKVDNTFEATTAAATGIHHTRPDANGQTIGPDVVTWTIEGRKRAHHLTATDASLLVPTMRVDGLVLLDPQADPQLPVARLPAAAARTLAAPSTTLPMPFERLETLTRIGALATDLPAFGLPRRGALEATVGDLAAIASAAQPRVSVVVPVFNGEAFIAEALRSIADQRSGGFEVIVVDDASADGSLAMVDAERAYLTAQGHELVVLRHEVNAGVAGARNTGIRAASGEFVSFLDQDDLWPPDRTQRLHTALRRAGAAAAFGQMTFADVGSGDRPWMRPEWFESDHPGHVLGASLLRREVFDSTGLLDQTIRTGYDDVDWLMRLRDSSAIVVDVPGIAVQRRIHDANQSRHSTRGAADLLATVRAHHARLAEIQPDEARPDDSLPVDSRRATSCPPVELDVVIPVHNVTRYLRAAVESALAQRGADMRVVVVDDGSDEDIAGMVESWHEPRVTVVRHAHNRGIGAARNTGAAVGEREWLGFLDADDLWPLDRTQQLLRGASGEALVIGQQLVFDGDNEPDPAGMFEFTNHPVGPLTGAMLFPRRVFQRLPRFDEDLRLGEFIDWIAQTRAAGVPEVQVPCVSLLRRSHSENTTRTRAAEFGDYLTVVARARARNRERADSGDLVPGDGDGPRHPSESSTRPVP